MVNPVTWLTPELILPWFGLWYSSPLIHRLTEFMLGWGLRDTKEIHPVWCCHFISLKSVCRGKLLTEAKPNAMKFRVFISHFHRIPMRRSLLGMNTRWDATGSVPVGQRFRKEIYCYLQKYSPTRHTHHQWIFSASWSLYWFLTWLLHTVRKFTFSCCLSVWCCQQCCQHWLCCSP